MSIRSGLVVAAMVAAILAGGVDFALGQQNAGGSNSRIGNFNGGKFGASSFGPGIFAGPNGGGPQNPNGAPAPDPNALGDGNPPTSGNPPFPRRFGNTAIAPWAISASVPMDQQSMYWSTMAMMSPWAWFYPYMEMGGMGMGMGMGANGAPGMGASPYSNSFANGSVNGAYSGYGPMGFGSTGYGPPGFGSAGNGMGGFGPGGYGPAAFGSAGYGPAGFGPTGYTGYGNANANLTSNSNSTARIVTVESEHNRAADDTPTEVSPGAPEEQKTPPPPAPGLNGPSDPAAAEKAREFAEKGEQEFRSGNYRGAANDWRHAVVDDPQNGVLSMMLGQALLASGQYEEAAGATQAAMRLLPDDQWGVVVKNRRELYGNARAYLDQLQTLGKVIKLKPDDAALRFLAGFHYACLGYPKAALEHLDRVLKAAPDDELARKLRDAMHAKLTSENAGPQPAPSDNPPGADSEK